MKNIYEFERTLKISSENYDRCAFALPGSDFTLWAELGKSFIFKGYSLLVGVFIKFKL